MLLWRKEILTFPQVLPHKYFTRNGQDIHLKVPISVPEAVLGGSIVVPTVTGKVEVKVRGRRAAYASRCLFMMY